MQDLRRIEDIAIEEGVPFLYLVAASPEWEHYEKAKCPKPIREWLAVHLPTAEIEPVRIDRRYACEWEKGATPSFQTSDELPAPIFRLRLTDEQALAFDTVWGDPARQPADGKDDFFFITLQLLDVRRFAEFDELRSSTVTSSEADEMARQ
jgi:hypothetical protein